MGSTFVQRTNIGNKRNQINSQTSATGNQRYIGNKCNRLARWPLACECRLQLCANNAVHVPVDLRPIAASNKHGTLFCWPRAFQCRPQAASICQSAFWRMAPGLSYMAPGQSISLALGLAHIIKHRPCMQQKGPRPAKSLLLRTCCCAQGCHLHALPPETRPLATWLGCFHQHVI